MSHKYMSPEHFARDHRDKVSDILQEKYMRFYDRTLTSVKHSWGFAETIGIPLFIAFLILTCNSTMEWYWVLAIVIAIALLVRYFGKHIVKISCLDLFSNQKEKAIDEYLAPFIEDELRRYPEEASDIEDYYYSVKRELEWWANVDINKKRSG